MRAPPPNKAIAPPQRRDFKILTSAILFSYSMAIIYVKIRH